MIQAARQETNTANREIPPYIPRFETTSTTILITKKGVPFGARREWAECLDMAVGAVLKYNDNRAWAELWALPKIVLRAPERGGAGTGKKQLKTQDKDARDGSMEPEKVCSNSIHLDPRKNAQRRRRRSANW